MVVNHTSIHVGETLAVNDQCDTTGLKMIVGGLYLVFPVHLITDATTTARFPRCDTNIGHLRVLAEFLKGLLGRFGDFERDGHFFTSRYGYYTTSYLLQRHSVRRLYVYMDDTGQRRPHVDGGGIMPDDDLFYQLRRLRSEGIPQQATRENYLRARRLNISRLAIARHFGLSVRQLHRLLEMWQLESAIDEVRELYGVVLDPPEDQVDGTAPL